MQQSRASATAAAAVNVVDGLGTAVFVVTWPDGRRGGSRPCPAQKDCVGFRRRADERHVLSHGSYAHAVHRDRQDNSCTGHQQQGLQVSSTRHRPSLPVYPDRVQQWLKSIILKNPNHFEMPAYIMFFFSDYFNRYMIMRINLLKIPKILIYMDFVRDAIISKKKNFKTPICKS